MRTIESIRIRNFRSIADQTVKLRPLNLLIGGNGSGKSNFIGVFQLLNRIAARELQTYTGTVGGADRILHFGRRNSSSLEIEVNFTEGALLNGYRVVLVPTVDDRFIFNQEHVLFHDQSQYPKPIDESIGVGHEESRLSTLNGIADYVERDLLAYKIYHFHDTSAAARMKQTGDIDDNRMLQADAGNLAAFLYRLESQHPDRFHLIEDTIRQVAPFFGKFDLEPSRLNQQRIRLEWREKGADSLFGPDSLSDGTLRFMCLATLFLQPSPPPVILIDEPELGLHPAAIALLADLLHAASSHAQVVVATQSAALVNQFEPDDLIVVERQQGGSVFRRLEAGALTGWLDNYALGDLWEKNLIGGRP